ncbi:hypothetical protein EST38_g6486, partial [Candolleomyces aberdarensis]
MLRSQAQNIDDCLSKLHEIILTCSTRGLRNVTSEETRKRVEEYVKAEKAHRRLEKDKRNELFILRYNPKDICNTSFSKYKQMKVKDRKAEAKRARAEKRPRSSEPFSEWDKEGPSSSTLRGDAFLLGEVQADVSSIKKELVKQCTDYAKL